MAIPFTPVPCKKWLSASNIGEFEALQSLKQFVTQNDWSGIHLLYPTQTDLATWQESQLIFREGHQFHWFNKTVKEQQPFENFGHFLEQMTARKRKTIKKERAHVQSQGIEFRWLMGNEIDENTLQQFYQFYQLTYAKRRMQGYLTLSFFRQIFCSMPDAVRLLVCQRDGQTLATALYFVDDTCLYGRYWGARDDFHLLHFEACYYQGIEYCIRHKLKHFNPGTQGEHKIARGFKPVLTHSLHHLFLAPFQQAIEQFCQEEAEHNALYMKECEQRLPFKQHNE